MLTGATIDANLIASVVQEIATGDPQGPQEAMLQSILAHCGVVISDGILTEWQQTCGGSTWFKEWYVTNLLERRLTPVSVAGDPVLRRILTTQFGMPISSQDYKYIFCAKQHPPHYLATEDHGLYDPRARQSGQRYRSRDLRQGRLCRFLWSQYGIFVGLLHHCHEELITRR